MSNAVGYKMNFIDLTCQSCGKTYKGKSKMRKYCDDCRYYRHLESCKKNKQREEEKNRASMMEIVPTLPISSEPDFTIAEVCAAARKHNMTYGKYVFAWHNGFAEPPEKFPQKRGRKKNDR